MRAIFQKILLGLIIFGMPLCVKSQSSSDSTGILILPFRHNKLSNIFSKELNTYSLNTGLQYKFTRDNFFVGLNENFNSTIVKSAELNIKDEQRLSLLSEYNFSGFIAAGGFLDQILYSDNRKLDINNATNFSANLFARLTPAEKISITPFGGVSANEQIGIENTGPTYGTLALIDNLELSDFIIYSLLKFQNEDISPRKNTARLFKLNVVNNFEEGINNVISAQYSQQRKDFYFNADSVISSAFNVENNIQSRTETNYFLQDRIFYSSNRQRLMIDLSGRVSWRNIDRNTRYILPDKVTASTFDTKIEEFKLDLSSQVIIRADDFDGFIRAQISEREEKYFPKKIAGANEIFYEQRVGLEEQKNNKSYQITLSASGNYKLSSDDDLALSLFHRKLQYDTPSEENFDDRDELLSIAKIYYSHRFNRLFSFFASLEGSINHIVYIFAERSSNNNIKRVIKLTSGGVYTGSRFVSSNTAEVSANYSVYDYEDLNPNIKSFAFRQLYLRDSTIIFIKEKLSLEFNGYIKLSEQGDFDWADFSGRPVRYLSESFAEPIIIYNYSNINFGLGMRYFSLKTFSYDSGLSKKLDTDYESIGPITQIKYSIGNKLDLLLYGWYEFINTEENIKRELVNMTFRVEWYF